ncbi:MAG: uridine phosphorylase [Chloroflexi bacterium]|nr:MAG: uridine phosphorylase [Chloroflexota bacterium]
MRYCDVEFHIQCEAAEIARYCFTPGDPARAKKIAAYFQDPKFVTDSRGYLVFSGHYRGVFMTVCATNMGGPTVAIALEELAHMGADTFIRVGSCGAVQPNMGPGDIVISTGAVRLGGTGNAYLPLHYPAVPTFQVTRALADAASAMNVPAQLGIGAAGDAFYAPKEGRAEMAKAGVLSLEMESDTLYIVGQFRGWRTGAIFATDGTPTEVKPAWGEQSYKRGEQNAIEIALDAMYRVAQQDGAG